MGYAKTAVLMAVLTAMFITIGGLVGGTGGALFALAIAAAINLFGYWNSDRMVLSMHGAREVDALSAPEFHTLVRDLAHRADLPMPKVYLIDTDQPNAFATGRDPAHAAVAATTGLLRTLSREELAGVIAHELAHIERRDTLIMTVTATLAGAIAMLANFAFFFRGGDRNGPGLFGTLAMMILAPMAAALVQMAISRAREYEADRRGAEICGRPLWLASALERIEGLAAHIDNPAAERNPATAHLFIINPLHALAHDRLFATHPPTSERVARLRAMTDAPGDTGGQARYSAVPEGHHGPWTRAAGSGAARRGGPWGGAVG